MGLMVCSFAVGLLLLVLSAVTPPGTPPRVGSLGDKDSGIQGLTAFRVGIGLGDGFAAEPSETMADAL